jgi:phosphatidate phosphatase LPIN
VDNVDLDVMLDAHGYKPTAEETLELDSLARQILSQETGNKNLDTLIGRDRDGNLWIYASEEAKQYAESADPTPHNDLERTPSPIDSGVRPLLKALTGIGSNEGRVSRAESEPAIPTVEKKDEGYSYAKTLRLTSEQLVYPPSVPFF